MGNLVLSMIAGCDAWYSIILEALASEGVTDVKNLLVLDDFDTDKIGGYIDHQSSSPKNTEMFSDLNTLKKFLFSSDSYIVLDNDN